jgi:hypothetical protein
MAVEDILLSFQEGGLYAKYLIGDIRCDFLDDDKLEDIATSDRQRINEDDPRYIALKSHIHRALKKIKNSWTDLRNAGGTRGALEIPAVKAWYETLGSDAKKSAAILFGKINALPVNKAEDRKLLYKHGIFAFERLRVRDMLSEIEHGTIDSARRFGVVLTTMEDIEAAMYHDIIEQRMTVVQEFSQIIDADEKEKIIQKHLFNHLWLLHSSWSRESGNARMEEQVKTAFKDIDAKLTKAEKAARFDIRYKSAPGKHVIIELKRAKRKVTCADLAHQVQKYRTALLKILRAQQITEPIEIICLLGDIPEDSNDNQKMLTVLDARIITYEQLIQETLASYKEYLDKGKEFERIKQVVDALEERPRPAKAKRSK